MPNNRPPRGGKPAGPRAGRPDTTGAPRARSGGGGASASRGAPRADGARPPRGESARPARGDSARAPRANDPRSPRGDSARPARGESARPPRAGDTRSPRGEAAAPPARSAYARPNRADEAPGRGDRSPSRGPSSRFGDTGASSGPRSQGPGGRSKGGPAAPRGGDRTRERHGMGPHAEAAVRQARMPLEPPIDLEPVLDAALAEAEGVQGGDIVFGRHAVMAALEGEQSINKVWVLSTLRNQELLAKVRQLAKEKGAAVQNVERPKLDQLTFEANHQGLVASVAPVTYVDLDVVIEAALATTHPALLVLDGIEDPHNLGALIRTAEGAGFAGVVIPNRRAVGITPVAYKSSAGAASRVPVARVGNLAQALASLKKAGFWIAGADAEGEKLPYEIDMTGPLVVVIGGEGRGLSRLLAEKCDWRVRLELGGALESLNASVAGGVLMYEAVRQRWAKRDDAGPDAG